MKTIALYLPQFHRIPENDEWWGKGFTEWTAVRNAKPLFEMHNQPNSPLDENYYDLLDKKTMVWQSELMHKYGVDGMCIYHYWFKDGRKILEKPAENLLRWKDIDMPFCLSWANETWARSWSGIKGKNIWADKFEQKTDNAKAVLLEQKYGSEDAWNEHFEYLCEFFRDERYIKIDGKPLFLIYKTKAITRLDEMISFWRDLAKKNGFPGIYIIGGDADDTPDGILDANLIKQPSVGGKGIAIEKKNGVSIRYYDDIWNNILKAKYDNNSYCAGFVGYDDTPRRGDNGYAILGGSPDKFGKYLSVLMKKNHDNKKDITFINAWNEWGEGMYLEPDNQYGYAYLEQIKYAKENYLSVDASYYSATDTKTTNKDTLYLNMLSKWMEMRESGIHMERFFEENGFKEIAIYGYSLFAKHLINELKDSDIKIKYIIDKNNIKCSLPLYSFKDKKPDVDVVVVCSFYYYKEIFSDLKSIGVKRIISLESLINELS